MIKSFVHKGLERFFLTGDTRGIQTKHAAKLAIILDWLDVAKCPLDMAFQGARLHELKGAMRGIWSVSVSGNWRVTFKFENGDAHVVNYQDYH